jgi:hypothetical protein
MNDQKKEREKVRKEIRYRRGNYAETMKEMRKKNKLKV